MRNSKTAKFIHDSDSDEPEHTKIGLYKSICRFQEHIRGCVVIKGKAWAYVQRACKDNVQFYIERSKDWEIMGGQQVYNRVILKDCKL